MVKILRFFAYMLFFIVALIYFMPKESVYFFAEKQLQKYHVVIDHESIKDRGLSLELQHLDVYVESIESANVERVSILFLGLYNEINVHNIKLSTAAASMLPTKIDTLNIKYSIINPINITLSAVGDFGILHGVANIKERKITLELKPSSLMKKRYKSALRNFKKQTNGEYEYVKNF